MNKVQGQSNEPWINVSRNIYFDQEKSPGAFFLDKAMSQTVEFAQVFIGDVDRGGSCNVNYLTFCPHNLTHIETSAHILSPDCTPPTVADIPSQYLQGTALLIDLSEIDTTFNGKILPGHIQPTLDTLTTRIQILGIKTAASKLPEHFDFSGQGFLSLAPETAKLLHDFSTNGSDIRCLILDLPSIDQEADEGKLLAHRAWFGLPSVGAIADDKEKRALIELAYFEGLTTGLYDVLITPPRFHTDAAPTGILLRKW